LAGAINDYAKTNGVFSFDRAITYNYCINEMAPKRTKKRVGRGKPKPTAPPAPPPPLASQMHPAPVRIATNQPRTLLNQAANALFPSRSRRQPTDEQATDQALKNIRAVYGLPIDHGLSPEMARLVGLPKKKKAHQRAKYAQMLEQNLISQYNSGRNRPYAVSEYPNATAHPDYHANHGYRYNTFNPRIHYQE
jgi:hypothetical protein